LLILESYKLTSKIVLKRWALIDAYDVAENWGHIQSELEKKGQALPIIDSLIACTGITHSMIVVTRNIKDMERSGVELINPFDVL
jgi:predicted nucleic acid-binding protein